ncbi:MAG: hypothetical protein LBK61_10925, partial [Spirochaetaceae bacterium]|nr:hypothetical protein [Spirochaetaceae bacterium]
MPANAGALLRKPVKEGFARAAVRFHLNLPQGRFWGCRRRALLRVRDLRAGSNTHKRGNSPP